MMLLALLLLIGLVVLTVWLARRRKQAADGKAQRAVTSDQVHVPDVLVSDQNGNKVHFYSDLLKDKTVIISFIFTSCKDTCPLVGANFAKIDHLLTTS